MSGVVDFCVFIFLAKIGAFCCGNDLPNVLSKNLTEGSRFTLIIFTKTSFHLKQQYDATSYWEVRTHLPWRE